MTDHTKIDNAQKTVRGNAEFGIKILHPGQARGGGGDFNCIAEEDTDLVLFTTDERAPVFSGGMFSGNTTASIDPSPFDRKKPS